jgi:SAM-dependent methyltransferase
VLYDLGSGDGRIPIMAARTYGIEAVGIDIDERRIAEANAQAWTAGVTEQVEFLLGDLFTADIREATVVTLYLLDVLNERLRPTLLRDLLPGTRIISHAFRMGDWEPEQTARIDGRMLYRWTVPAPSGARAVNAHEAT